MNLQAGGYNFEDDILCGKKTRKKVMHDSSPKLVKLL